jgi:Zn-dependent protease
LVFLAVLLHELGHALMARRLGIATDRIVLYPIGGGAFMSEMPEEPRREIPIALAGPGINIALALALAPYIWQGNGGNFLLILERFWNPSGNLVLFDVAQWEYMVVLFFVFNVLLGLFNLLPFYPLDGGRVLRAWLHRHYPRTRATIVAARWGLLGGGVLCGIGAAQGDAFMAGGALLMMGLAFSEMRVQQRRHKLYLAEARQYLLHDYPRFYLSAGHTLGEVRRELPTADTLVLLLDEWQQPHGITTRSALFAANLDGAVHEDLRALVGTARWEGLLPQSNLLEAAERMDNSQLFAFVVIDHYGRIHGLLDRSVVEQIIGNKWTLH